MFASDPVRRAHLLCHETGIIRFGPALPWGSREVSPYDDSISRLFPQLSFVLPKFFKLVQGNAMYPSHLNRYTFRVTLNRGKLASKGCHVAGQA